MDSNTLILSILFGSVGMGMFVYGKNQQRVAYLVSGLGLMVFPYFISNTIMMILVGAVLAAAPFLIP